MESVLRVLKRVQRGKKQIANITDEERNGLLIASAMALKMNVGGILDANKKDVENAIALNKPQSFVDRLKLSSERINGMADNLIALSKLKSPVNNVLSSWTTEKGMRIKKVCVPLGVVGIVYEARPNVTSDCIGLAIKSGNAVVLRGGSDAINSNKAVVSAISGGLMRAGFSPEFIGLIEDTTHESVDFLLKQRGMVDVIIPRGGKNLIKNTVANSSVPVIETGLGNCHVYIHEKADEQQALKIGLSAKISRVSVCNSAENLVVDRSIAKDFLPKIAKLFEEHNVEMRGDSEVAEIIPNAKIATAEDYYTEYNDYIITIKIVEDIKEAIAHINEHSTHHSDSIITEDKAAVELFSKEIDSACVFINTTTRESDGFEFGFGAEVGISTQKLHARGPFGIEGLTTYKYVIDSDYLIR